MTTLERPPAGSSLRWLISDTLVFTGRKLAHIRQLPEKLLEVTVQPVMFVLLFAYVFGGAISVPGGNYREYLIGGILVQSLAFGLTGPATTIATDLTEGVLDRFLSLPTARVAYLLGHVTAELAGMTLAMTILSLSGLLVGWQPHNSVLEVIAAYALLLLFASSMIWLGTLIGLSVRSADAVTGVVFIVVFPITFLSNAFVPIGSLPTVLKYMAAYNPISAMAAATRQLWGNPTAPSADSYWPLEHPVIASLASCLILLAIIVPLTLVRFRQRTTS